MNKEVRITTVSIEIGKKKIDLTVEEAKQLLEILSDTFGEKINTIIKEIEIHHDWYRPYVIYTDPPTRWQPYIATTWFDNAGNAIGSNEFTEGAISINLSAK